MFLGNLVKLVYGPRNNWYDIGIALSISYSILHSIDYNYSQIESALGVVLIQWINKDDKQMRVL